MLGSIDANRGDYQNAWDTDQFPNNINETVELMLVILRAGGLQGGGVNFDAKTRRNSTDLADMFYGHIGGMDTFARALLIADSLLQNLHSKACVKSVMQVSTAAKALSLSRAKMSLADLAAIGNSAGEPAQTSGKQELYELIINRYIR